MEITRHTGIDNSETSPTRLREPPGLVTRHTGIGNSKTPPTRMRKPPDWSQNHPKHWQATPKQDQEEALVITRHTGIGKKRNTLTQRTHQVTHLPDRERSTQDKNLTVRGKGGHVEAQKKVVRKWKDDREAEERQPNRRGIGCVREERK